MHSCDNLPLPRRSSRTCRLPANKRAFVVFIHVALISHYTLFDLTLTILFRASFLDRFFCRAIEDEDTKISQIQTVTYLSSPELFVLLWVVGRRPAMKRNSFYREILLNTRLLSRSHRNSRSIGSYCDENTTASMEDAGSFAIDRKSRQLYIYRTIVRKRYTDIILR